MSEDRKPWRIGIAGLGVVGSSLGKFLAEAPDFSPAHGRAVVTGVSARTRKDRGFDISDVAWFDDAVALAKSPDIDLFVELIGGAEGVAKAAVEAALESGKAVVTANKALIATHGQALAKLAEAKGAALLYEASVMGGVPAVKMLREGLTGEEVTSVAGILNGTCNFILSEMERTERGFADVLAEAQKLGYAEADPTTDVGGFDAAHKIAILAALAFGGAPNLGIVEIEGIDKVDLIDIRLARDLGYRIKLIASAERDGEGASIRVNPALVPLNHPLAQAGGALNALFIEGRRIGRIYMQGPGAGGSATAAAVAADIADAMARPIRPVFQAAAEGLGKRGAAAGGDHRDKAFLRLMVQDRPGVIAAVSEALAKANVSIDSFLQKPVEDTGHVPIVLITHPASASALDDAVGHIAALEALVEAPRRIRVARI
jgi:homoserine dehydrogenase